jgi:hypothetical protein
VALKKEPYLKALHWGLYSRGFDDQDYDHEFPCNDERIKNCFSTL